MPETRLTYPESFQIYRTLDQHRIGLWIDRLRRAGGIDQNSVFLDIGCGIGRFTGPLAERTVSSCGVDNNWKMINLAVARYPCGIHWICAAAEALPLNTGSFTHVLTSMVMEHVRDKAAMFGEIGRVLRSRGLWLLRTMLPEDIGKTTWYRFVPGAAKLEEERTISLGEIERLAKAAGLRIVLSESHRDKVDAVAARTLPARLTARSYQILERVDCHEIVAACREIAGALAHDDYEEYMSSSLIVLEKQ